MSQDRQAFAVLAVALAGLLISPISWTHHWVWVILLPPILVGPRRSEIPGPVRILFWGLVGITIGGPYWWFSSGVAADLADALLPIWTFGVLVTWAALEYRTWRSTDPHAIDGRDLLAIQQSV